MRLANSQSELEKWKEKLDGIHMDTRKQVTEWDRLRNEVSFIQFFNGQIY
jgi:hypothetical protein